MRSLPVGWMMAIDTDDQRRELSIEMSRATHPDRRALVAACVIAACGAWSLEGASPRLLLEVAGEEEAAAAALLGVGTTLGDQLAGITAGTWHPPAEGISLDACDTAAAVLDCVMRATSLRDGLRRAVNLGGDTDTAAALVGGILAARLDPDAVRTQLPWHTAVHLPDETTVDRLASGLVALRARPAT